MIYQEAIKLLRKAVKYSTIDKQKHIDLSLVVAAERSIYEEALIISRKEVVKGTITEEKLKEDLGLI